MVADLRTGIQDESAPVSPVASGRSQKEESTRIPSLDGLRAVSILLVIISHVVYTNGFVLPSIFDLGWFEGIGGLGVRVFFVISGYLITSLLLKELESTGTIHVPRFYLRRTLRIFVPYYFFLLIVILLNSLSWVQVTFQDLLHAFTYTINYYPERSWDTSHAWSLSVEEQFYLIWPTILLIAGKRRALWIALSFVVLAPLIRLGYYYAIPSFVEYEIGYRFETCADAIAVGCLLAGMQQWIQASSLYQKVMDSRLVFLVPFIVLYASKINPESRLYVLFGVTIQNIGIATCIAWSIRNYAGTVGKMLNWRPVVFLGTISYSVYLWQQIFTNYLSTSVISTFPFNIFLIGPASIISFYLVERPSLKLRVWLENKLFRHERDGRALQVSRSNISEYDE